MHLSPLLLASMGLVGVISGRLLFGRWFNHLSLYSLIWGLGLTLFELGWIYYTPLTAEVWMMIGYAWFAFATGSAILILARTAAGAQHGAPASELPNRAARLERRLLAISLVILSGVALAAVMQHWSILIKKFGSITAVLLNSNVVYRLRVEGKLPGIVPYFDSFGLAAVYVAGLYSARVGTIKLLALFPLLTVILESIGLAGRSKMLIAAILFYSAYSLAKSAPLQEKVSQLISISSKGKRLLMLGFVLALIVVAAEIIRTTRGTYEHFSGTSRTLNKLASYGFVTPSIYLYLSSHPGVFNAYWKAGGEHPFPGSNTFAPIFRILSRLGIADYVPEYMKFYNIPISTNTGTYLRELHADFGITGIMVAPYLLGFLCTILWFRIKHRARLMPIAWLSHLYVVVAMTYLVQATRLGYWVVSLVTALVVSGFIDYRCNLELAGKKKVRP